MGDLVTTQNTDLLEQVVVGGDLARLSASQRLEYYSRVCESMGLNPLTQPFQYIRLNGRLTLYATRAAADQLRKLNGVSITNLDVDLTGDMAVVTCSGRDNSGRADTDVGVVPLKGLGGDARANAVLKAVTKAKRRMTLSLCGLGWLDETEIETIPDAQPVTVTNAGEIAEPNDGDQHEPDNKQTPGDTHGYPPRPWDAETTKRAILAKVKQIGDTQDASGKFRNFVAGRVNELFDADPTTKNAKRHSVLLYVFGVDSSSQLNVAQCKALLAWSTDKVEEDGQEVLLPNDHAISEAAAMVAAYEAEKGQMAMDMQEAAS